MADDFDPEWHFVHTGYLPSDNRAVAVLVVGHNGQFHADIGRYYGKDNNGWLVQFWGKELPVIAWMNIAPFKDDTPYIEHED